MIRLDRDRGSSPSGRTRGPPPRIAQADDWLVADLSAPRTEPSTPSAALTVPAAPAGRGSATGFDPSSTITCLPGENSSTFPAANLMERVEQAASRRPLHRRTGFDALRARLVGRAWRARSAASGAATSCRSRASTWPRNALLEAADRADDARHIAGRLATVGRMAERPALRPLPAEPFDPTVALQAKADRKARIAVRGSRYSVPAACAGRTVDVRLGGGTVALLGGRVLARQSAARTRGLRSSRARPLPVCPASPGRCPARARSRRRAQAVASPPRTSASGSVPAAVSVTAPGRVRRGAALASPPPRRGARWLDAVRVGGPGAGRHRGAPRRRRPPRDRRRGAAGARRFERPAPSLAADALLAASTR